MDKIKMIILLTLLIFGSVAAQDVTRCITGDCHTGYAYATLVDANNKEIGYQVGFYDNGLLHGIANQTSDFGKYWGTYKNGLKEGFFSYESEGNMYAFGMFVNDKKEGMHVIRNKTGYDFRDYINDKHVSNSPLPTTGLSPCVMGNCQNGKGVKVNGSDAVYSNWKNGNLHGMTMQFLMSEKKIVFSEFSGGIVNGLQMIWYFDGSKEIMQMQNGARNGQYLKKNQNNTHEATICKDGQPIMSF